MGSVAVGEYFRNSRLVLPSRPECFVVVQPKNPVAPTVRESELVSMHMVWFAVVMETPMRDADYLVGILAGDGN